MFKNTDISRRDFIKAGSGLVLGLSTLGVLGCSNKVESSSALKPDFVVIITDQERHHRHFPKGWITENMTSWGRLKKNGITFNNAFTSASQCSPSRACMLTGQHSKVNKIPSFDFPNELPTTEELPNIASMLRSAGYDVVWKGKWHLSYPIGFGGGSPSKEVWTEADAVRMKDRYELDEWNPPEAGNNIFNSEGARKTLGGGTPNNDGRYVIGATAVNQGQTDGYGESAVEYLKRVGSIPRNKRKPFCLFVSLVNPHDSAFYPKGWDQAGYKLEDFDGLGMPIPENYNDPLDTKPSIQKLFRDTYDEEDPLKDALTRQRFVNFYAYLHKVVDVHINKVLDALDKYKLTDSTIIFRTADHGEFGLAHGLREKSYAAYEEVIHVPLVISNPGLFPRPVETDALYSHLDLSATIGELAGAKKIGAGTSVAPVLYNPNTKVQDSVLFTYDDNFIFETEPPASHIRTLRTEQWTYSVYYSPDGSQIEYEMYDNYNDPLQMTNLLYKPSSASSAQWKTLHEGMTKKMTALNAVPDGFTWPVNPAG